MNLQAREVRGRATVKRRGAVKSGGGAGILVVLNVLMFGAALFFVVNYRVSLSDETARANRETAQLKRHIHRYEREIEYLRIRRETLTGWTYVRSRIRYYNLALVAPEPHQVRQVVIDRHHGGISVMEPEVLVVSKK